MKKFILIVGISVINGFINPLSAKLIKWSNTLKQIVGNLPTICLSVFEHFSGLALKGLKIAKNVIIYSEKPVVALVGITFLKVN